MLLVITERNAWEQEAWTYVLDINKQEAAAVSYLMMFSRLANEEHSKASKEAYAEQNKNLKSMGGFALMMRGPAVFASSGYSVEFYDSCNQGKGSDITLTRTGSTLCANSRASYKSSGIMLDAKISVSKMKSALTAMREKKENKLYKNFESVFLKTPTKKAKVELQESNK